jgi:pyruvate/2-oxoglutarate dehydrogenase complex dihydrolipoamide dehydrogenase (E3) component
MGVRPVVPQVDYAAAKDHVARVIAAIAPVDSQERFEGLGVRVLRAWARMTGPDTVEAGGETIRARRIVIATGSRPFVPPIPGLAETPYLTNETIFALRERPEHLIVLGGGPIGMEMAQAHRRLGSRVTVVEAAKALGREDAAAAAVVVAALRAEGIEIIEGRAAERAEATPSGVALALAGGRRIEGSHLLVAVGRKVMVADMGLDRGNVAFDGRGVKVDAGLRSVTNRRVYAVGDAAGGLQFTHLAGYHAGIVIRSALFGLPARARTDHIPRATYTDPEIAHVGLTEAEARAAHPSLLEVLEVPFHDNDRAQATGKTSGFVKLMAVKGRPLGVTIVGEGAGELIAPWALAISAGLKLSAVAGAVLPYPTMAEAGKRAAGAYFSPRLFGNAWVKRAVRIVQRVLP